MADTPHAFAFDEARRVIEGQERALESVRTRATVLLSVAGVSVGLLADENVNGAAWVAIALAVLVGGLAVALLTPKRVIFDNDVGDLLVEMDSMGADDADAVLRGTQRDWAYWMATDHIPANQRQLDRMNDRLRLAAAALLVELVVAAASAL